MRKSDVPSQEAQQGTLIPARAYEITLKVGIMPADEHCQMMLEVRNATDGTLLRMESIPHCLPENFRKSYHVFERALDELIFDLTGPFPSL